MTYFFIIAFTTVPTTQYVWINQTATFTCATNYKYTLTFSSSNDVPLIQQEDQGGATASFIVTADNNGTSVRCIAYSGSTPLHTSLAYAYAQGIAQWPSKFFRPIGEFSYMYIIFY